MHRTILLAFLSLSAITMQAQKKVKPKELFRLMQGHFSSEAQSKTDSAFFHISLRMTPIWKNRKDGRYLYVEQAMAGQENKPYRQRIYHLFPQDDTTMVSKVFELKNAAGYVNAGDAPERLEQLTMDSLVDRQGCAIFLHKNAEGNYVGSTPGKQCLSSLRGATYATSEVTIGPQGMVSWDRGWTAADKQVWGAVKGGYRFDKIN